MRLAVDVDYREDRAWVAGVLFRDWDDAKAASEHTTHCAIADAYRSGKFFRRELPCIEHLLMEIDEPLDCVVVDGYVNLGSERRRGLGKHLFDALKQEVSVIGVAKTPYRDTPTQWRYSAVEVLERCMSTRSECLKMLQSSVSEPCMVTTGFQPCYSVSIAFAD